MPVAVASVWEREACRCWRKRAGSSVPSGRGPRDQGRIQGRRREQGRPRAQERASPADRGREHRVKSSKSRRFKGVAAFFRESGRGEGRREREKKNRRAFSLSSPSQSSSTLPPLVLALFSSRESAWTHQRSSLWRRTHFPPSLLTRGRRQRAKGERWSLASARRRRCARSPSCSSSPWPRLFRPSPLPREVPCATRRETAWFCTPTRSGRSRTRGEEAWGGGEGGDPFFFEFDRGRSPLTMACSPSGGRT